MSECGSFVGTRCPGGVQCQDACKLEPENGYIEKLEAEVEALRRELSEWKGMAQQMAPIVQEYTELRQSVVNKKVERLMAQAQVKQ